MTLTRMATSWIGITWTDALGEPIVRSFMLLRITSPAKLVYGTSGHCTYKKFGKDRKPAVIKMPVLRVVSAGYSFRLSWSSSYLINVVRLNRYCVIHDSDFWNLLQNFTTTLSPFEMADVEVKTFRSLQSRPSRYYRYHNWLGMSSSPCLGDTILWKRHVFESSRLPIPWASHVLSPPSQRRDGFVYTHIDVWCFEWVCRATSFHKTNATNPWKKSIWICKQTNPWHPHDDAILEMHVLDESTLHWMNLRCTGCLTVHYRMPWPPAGGRWRWFRLPFGLSLKMPSRRDGRREELQRGMWWSNCEAISLQRMKLNLRIDSSRNKHAERLLIYTMERSAEANSIALEFSCVRKACHIMRAKWFSLRVSVCRWSSL